MRALSREATKRPRVTVIKLESSHRSGLSKSGKKIKNKYLSLPKRHVRDSGNMQKWFSGLKRPNMNFLAYTQSAMFGRKAIPQEHHA